MSDLREQLLTRDITLIKQWTTLFERVARKYVLKGPLWSDTSPLWINLTTKQKATELARSEKARVQNMFLNARRFFLQKAATAVVEYNRPGRITTTANNITAMRIVIDSIYNEQNYAALATYLNVELPRDPVQFPAALVEPQSAPLPLAIHSNIRNLLKEISGVPAPDVELRAVVQPRTEPAIEPTITIGREFPMYYLTDTTRVFAFLASLPTWRSYHTALKKWGRAEDNACYSDRGNSYSPMNISDTMMAMYVLYVQSINRANNTTFVSVATAPVVPFMLLTRIIMPARVGRNWLIVEITITERRVGSIVLHDPYRAGTMSKPTELRDMLKALSQYLVNEAVLDTTNVPEVRISSDTPQAPRACDSGVYAMICMSFFATGDNDLRTITIDGDALDFLRARFVSMMALLYRENLRRVPPRPAAELEQAIAHIAQVIVTVQSEPRLEASGVLSQIPLMPILNVPTSTNDPNMLTPREAWLSIFSRCPLELNAAEFRGDVCREWLHASNCVLFTSASSDRIGSNRKGAFEALDISNRVILIPDSVRNAFGEPVWISADNRLTHEISKRAQHHIFTDIKPMPRGAFYLASSRDPDIYAPHLTHAAPPPPAGLRKAIMDAFLYATINTRN